MKRTLIYTTALTLATAVLISAGYVSANMNEGGSPNVGNGQIFSNRWRIVKQTFRLRIPQNNKFLSQLIIEVPSTVAVSNDIDVRDETGQKININISADGKKIILDFPEKISSNTMLIELNKVRQPIQGSASIYRFSVKVVGSNTEIYIGEARFLTF
ncbi:hypothetical protein IQ264_04580 [Phormidium sp. LEGE 05292]|uniref:hypothetical protein n=1 Tax=[Phormidium] sp. LEGE 05292 TaxID=767427 RepID=UPI00187E30D4|nr:hypothetical protein [Phormidium sp. LEGE 05292]MBE9224743.1 hypothetical protein [Phormidium sp. LEGE 05292]